MDTISIVCVKEIPWYIYVETQVLTVLSLFTSFKMTRFSSFHEPIKNVFLRLDLNTRYVCVAIGIEQL